MESILRAMVTYLFVWVIFRLAGKRTLAQITTFDVVLLLIISEATQAALLDDDNSMTNSFLLIMTLLGMDVLFSMIKRWSPTAEKIMDGMPCMLVDQGELNQECMRNERVQEDDILCAARANMGLANLDEIEFAVLEQNGGISVVPKRPKESN